MQLENAPKRRHGVKGRNHFAFSDVRRPMTEKVLSEGFPSIWPHEGKSVINSIAATMLRMAA